MTATLTVLPTIPKISDYRLLQASGDFEYRFEELAIEIDTDCFAGSFSGTADVTYWNDEEGLEWFVGNIGVDCNDGRKVALEPSMYLSGHPTFSHRLYLAIYGELTDGSFKDAVEAKVMQEIEA